MTLPASENVGRPAWQPSGRNGMGPAQLSDEQLLAGFTGGETTMLAELVRRHERGLYSFICRLGADESEAADLFQETFLRVCQHAGSFQGRSSFKTWLYGIATNLCRTRLAQAGRPVVVPGQADCEPPDTTPGPEDAAGRREIGRRVGLAVSKLPHLEREVLLLRVYDEMSYREIAQVVGRPLGTVRSQMQRALSRLRTTLVSLAPTSDGA